MWCGVVVERYIGESRRRKKENRKFTKDLIKVKYSKATGGDIVNGDAHTKRDISKEIPQPLEHLSPSKQLIQVVIGFCLAFLVYFLTSEFISPDFNVHLKENPTEFFRLMNLYYYVLASIYIFLVFPKWAKWTKKSQLIIGYPVAFGILIFPRVLSFFVSQNIAIWASLLPCGSIFITFIKTALEPKQIESEQSRTEKSTKDFKKEVAEILGLHGSFSYYICIASILEYGLICVTSIPMNYTCLSTGYVLNLAFILSTSFCFGYFSKKISETLLSFLEKEKFKDYQIRNLRHAYLLRNLLGFIIFGIWIYFLSSLLSFSFLVKSLFFIPLLDFSLPIHKYALIILFIATLGALIGKFLVSHWWKNLSEKNRKNWEEVINVHAPEPYEIVLNSISSGLFRTIFIQQALILFINSLIALELPFLIRLIIYAFVAFFFFTILGNVIRWRSAMFGFDEKTMAIIIMSTILSPMFSISVDVLFRYFRAKLLKNSLT